MADAEVRSAQQLWRAAVRCAAAAMTPQSSPEPVNGGQTQGLVEGYTYPHCPPQPLGGFPSRSEPQPLGGFPHMAPPGHVVVPVWWPSAAYSGHAAMATAGFEGAAVPQGVVPWPGYPRVDGAQPWASAVYGPHVTGHMPPALPQTRPAAPIPESRPTPAEEPAWTALDAAAVLVGLPDQQGFWKENPKGSPQRRSPTPGRPSPIQDRFPPLLRRRVLSPSQRQIPPRRTTPLASGGARPLPYPSRPPSVPRNTSREPENPSCAQESNGSGYGEDEVPIAVITLSSTRTSDATSEEDGPEETSPPMQSAPVLETAEELASLSDTTETREDPAQGVAGQEMENRRFLSQYPSAAASSRMPAPVPSLRYGLTFTS
jgi:hypothetical protein